MSGQSENITFPKLFTDSTHQFMYGTNGTLFMVLGWVVTCLQIAVYGFMIFSVRNTMKPYTIPLVMENWKCLDYRERDYDGSWTFSNSPSWDDISCSVNGENNFLPMILAITILCTFVFADIIASFILITKSRRAIEKGAGIFILMGSALGIAAGAAFAVSESGKGTLNVFLGCVGVAFVHDIDEKIFRGMNYYKDYFKKTLDDKKSAQKEQDEVEGANNEENLRTTTFSSRTVFVTFGTILLSLIFGIFCATLISGFIWNEWNYVFS